MTDFVLPTPRIGRFAVVKLWPSLKTAEDECIERLKIAAQKIGVECVLVDKEGRFIAHPDEGANKHNVDFVIHLHFETPKAYDAFSFVALWNPLQFYFDWDYRKCSRNLLTHDDFLSCGSSWADDHVRRMSAQDAFRDTQSLLTMYHSVSEPIHEPSLGEGRIFYCGINWERILGKPGRFDHVLKMLDGQGILRIHGPNEFQGIKVWKGFSSFVGPLPFDGHSVVEAIHQAGICLVLSSDAHKQSGLMSSRLFEGLAAGAAIICDENPFAREHFGDTLFYIESWKSADVVRDQILAHRRWILDHSAEAVDRIRQAQKIFHERFSLDHSLSEIYRRLDERKTLARTLRFPATTDQVVHLISIVYQWANEDLSHQLENMVSQDYGNIQPVVLLNRTDRPDVEMSLVRAREEAQRRLGRDIKVIEYQRGGKPGELPGFVGIGQVLADYLTGLPDGDLVCIVAPNERLFSDHISSLVKAFEVAPQAPFVVSEGLLTHKDKGEVFYDHDAPFTRSVVPLESSGRFLIRWGHSMSACRFTLRCINFRLACAIIPGGIPAKVQSTRRATIVQDIQHPFYFDRASAETFEWQIIRDSIGPGFEPEMPERVGQQRFSISHLSKEARLELLKDLLKSLPMPRFIFVFLRSVYRRYKRRLSFSSRSPETTP